MSVSVDLASNHSNSSYYSVSGCSSCVYLDDVLNHTEAPCVCPGNQTRGEGELLVMGPPLYLYVYVTVINVIVFLVGIVGNGLVVQVVLCTRSMHRRINYFLVSLSVADLCVLVVCMPVALLEFYGKDKWYIGIAMCKIVPFLESASHQCSVLTLLAIGCERYWGICHPLKRSAMSRVMSPYVVIPVVWLLSSVVSLPFAIISDIEVEMFYDGSLVDVCRTDMSTSLAKAYTVATFVMCLVLPLVVLSSLYTAIILKLLASTSVPSNTASSISRSPRLASSAAPIRLVGGSSSMAGDTESHVQNSRAIASRHQVVRMMIAVMILYFLCLLPMRIFQLVMVFSPGSKVDLGFEPYLNSVNCGRILIYVNSAGNPIIYGWLSSNFRSAFLQTFAKCFGRRRHRYNGANSYNCNAANYKSTYAHDPRQNTYSTHLTTAAQGRNNFLVEDSSPFSSKNNSPRNSTTYLSARSKEDSAKPGKCSSDKVDVEVSILADGGGRGKDKAAEYV